MNDTDKPTTPDGGSEAGYAKSESPEPTLPESLHQADSATSDDLTTVVGIGTSAGGLAALKQFFDYVPEDTGLAFVVVIHLSPDHKSQLAELLQPHVRMPVQQVTETIRLEPNHVYVIPPGANLESIDTHLRLADLEANRQERAPIDHFFRTLGKTNDGRAIGVVLTGTGSDGTLGLREIKQHGGLAIVQDPNEAEYDGMPQSVVATGVMDAVLPLADIPQTILKFAGTSPRLPPIEIDSHVESDADLLNQLFALIQTRTGRDFSHYKRSTILRRIARRMQFNFIEDLQAYTKLLKGQPYELVALADDLLINVSSFFRDPEVYEHLSKTVVPELFDKTTNDQPLRVWSVGCATGEEAYSLAMLLLEEARRRDVPRVLQVFASDLHEQSLKVAREGFYAGDIQVDVGGERLKRFFSTEEGGYRVRKEVRDIVVFAHHNLLSDPPFSRLDLIVCRNLLIYLQRQLQPDVSGLFHYALKPDGFLLLGTSETLEAGDLFTSQHKPSCLFRKCNVPGPEPGLPVFPMHLQTVAVDDRHEKPSIGTVDHGKLHHIMAEQLAPPSILVNADNRIVHLSAHAGRFLLYPGGDATNSVFKLVREELQLELRTLIAEVRENRKPTQSDPIRVRLEGEISSVIVRVRPITDPLYSTYLLVVFNEQKTADESRDESATPQEKTDRERDHIRTLGSELALSRQRVQALIEDYESSREELQSSNEELQSSNEELRSTLEELETSKEELQSLNEELQTVNQENRHKVEELAQLSSDLQNLLAAIDIATLFLDRDLRILRFTPKVGELFNIRKTDRGRPLADFTHRLGYPELQDDAKLVLQRLIPIEHEAQDEQGNWYLVRVLPYRDVEERIAGVVLTCIDITNRKHAEIALRESEERFRMATDAVQGVIYAHDLKTDHVQWSSGLAKVSGYEPDEVGSSIRWWWERVHPKDRPGLECIPVSNGKLVREYRLRHKAGHWVYLWDQALVVSDNSSEPTTVIGCAVDVTAQREFEDSLQQARAVAETANRSRGEFLANMSHEVRTPMTAILGHAEFLGDRLKDPDDLHAVDTITRNGRFLLEVINDILDLSKIDAGRFKVDRRRIRLDEVVSDTITLIEMRVKEKQLSLEVQFEGPLPETIETDPVRLRQILLNLLSNAIKFTDEGSVRLVVRYQSDMSRLIFDVIDTGVGIHEKDLPLLFEPFTQVDASTTRRFEGTGLGLAISRHLAEALDGELSVESQPQVGSKFSLNIGCGSLTDVPLLHLGLTDSPHADDAEERLTTTGTILLVDDRRDVRFLAQRLIEKAGGRIISAANGQDALDQIAADNELTIDLVVMDMHMPVMDGYEATRQLRTRGCDLPIIAMTANAMSGDRDQCLEVGCSDYISKPLNSREFIQIIARNLQRGT